jgi:hypothetical protein
LQHRVPQNKKLQWHGGLNLTFQARNTSMKRIQSLSAAVLFWGALVGGSAQANEITIFADAPGTAAGTIGTLTGTDLVGIVATSCAIATCDPLNDGPYSQSTTSATWFNSIFAAGSFPLTLTGASNTANEVTTINALFNTNFLTGVKDDDSGNTFSMCGGCYFTLKIGDGWAFFHNEGSTGNLVYAGAGPVDNPPPGSIGTGLSHTTVAVPGPIVGAGLPGLVMACGGLLALARRRRKLVV